jgi:hypothetical protein
MKKTNMQYQGIVLVELSSIIYHLAGIEEYVLSLQRGNLTVVSRFVEGGQIHIDATVSKVASSAVSDFR